MISKTCLVHYRTAVKVSVKVNYALPTYKLLYTSKTIFMIIELLYLFTRNEAYRFLQDIELLQFCMKRKVVYSWRLISATYLEEVMLKLATTLKIALAVPYGF